MSGMPTTQALEQQLLATGAGCYNNTDSNTALLSPDVTYYP